MVKKDTYESIRGIFFQTPSKHFHAREIARMVGVSHPIASKYLKSLEKENIIEPTEYGYKAKPSAEYKMEKRFDTAARIQRCGLLDKLTESSRPSAVVLFGSASRGEDDEGSDIDIFIEGQEKKTDLRPYEKKMGRKINITYGRLNKLNKEFLESVINGILLYGGIRI